MSPNERQVPVPIEEEMRKSYLDYAMSVIIGRALPDIRDGLKPVHRRILYAMEREGLHYNRRYSKCAGVVGEVLKHYHPHGDTAVYDALVRLAQEWNLRYPLVDGQGNFGSVDGDPAAAYRYTEARLAKIAHEMLADIDKDTVDFVPNFDGFVQEPSVLPTKLPNLLVNGSAGIAVGMATNIPPHNLSEVVDGLVMLIDDPAATVDDLTTVIKGPDFPTRGYIYGTGGIREAYTTGRGTITMRAKAHAEKMRGGREAIIVTELPYQVNKATLIEKIAELSREKKIEGLSEIRDESNREGIRIVLEVGRGEIPQIILNQLHKHTSLQSTFGVIMLALVDRRPQVVTLKEMLEAFIRFRREVVTRRTGFDLARAEERAHILQGLRKAVEQLDLAIRLIRGAENPEAAKDALMRRLELTEVQAKAILDMRLQRLTQLERHKIVEEHEQTLVLIADLKDILASEWRLMRIIKDELEALKAEYGDERRTEILTETTELTIEDLLADEEMVVTITRSGYIKRTHVDLYRSQRRGGKGVTGMETKEEDIVEDLFIATTHSYLLFFTSQGKVHWLKVHEIPEGGRQAKGKAMANLLSLGEGERVATVLAIREFEAGGFILFATKQGKVKKTELEAYSHPRAGGIQAIALEEGDEVMAARRTDGQREVVMSTKKGTIIRFSEEECRPMGRVTAGVRGIDVEDGDQVIAAEVVLEGAALLTVTERGYGKQTPLEEYRLQGRAGKGIIDIKTGGRNGDVVGVVQARPGDDILVVTTKGKIIRMHAPDVSSQGRNTWGVRVIDLDPDDQVGSVARVDAEQVEPES
ncbi:MAG: DNA gyrase subunit A [Candidatus Rokubacteria bacterium RIFCSPLOWO2_12_FULL_69_21]|nr:MAG: DNA gyrase subunit A [Candidatus Rokubacteria bacterium RIFCSPLOWO2_12_FULL_69_21]